ncbi:MAG: LysM peptidoglycan-binding domain-containing protein [Elusimicrobiota bacterium]
MRIIKRQRPRLEFKFKGVRMKEIKYVAVFVFFMQVLGAGTAFSRVATEIEGIDVPSGKELILDVYTVKKGDYLAKLARREYGNWKKWRIIYDYNDFIRDPHWIFPGDKIILPRIVDELPEVPEAEQEEEKEEVKESEEKREYGDFLAPEDFSFDGSIIAFRDEKKMHAQGDYCFIDLGSADGIKEGMKFYVYRSGPAVTNPQTGLLEGFLTKKVGALRVTEDIEGHTSTTKIILSHEVIKKGDTLIAAQ